MATTADWLPLAEINAQAREWDPLRFLLTLLAAPLFALGWTVAKSFAAVWLVGAWVAAAVLVGYRAGRDADTGPPGRH